jgi:hypothetical protein
MNTEHGVPFITVLGGGHDDPRTRLCALNDN